MSIGRTQKCPLCGQKWAFEVRVCWILADERELVFAFFDERQLGDGLIGGDFLAIDRDGVVGDELASFTFTRCEASGNENVDEVAESNSWEAFCKKLDFVGRKIGKLAVAKDDSSDFLSGQSGIFAMNDSSDEFGKTSLAKAGAWIFAMFIQNFVEFFWGDESEVFEVIFECFVGLVEPELIEIEDGSFFAIKPDGVAFGFAKFATGDFIDDEWTGVAVGFGVFETRNEMNARSAVTKLIGAAELKSYVVFAEEVQEIVALDEGVTKLGIRDAGTAFADAILDELAIK